ncbi:MAG: class E sortase [Scrofimicrobium sp.]
MSSPYPSRSEVHRSGASNGMQSAQSPVPEPPGDGHFRPTGRVAAPKKPKRSAWSLSLQILGELMMTAGAVFLLFVVWQLWWTSVEVQPGIKQRVAEFERANPATEQVVPAENQRTDDPPAVAQVPYGEVFGVLHVPKWDMAIPISEGVGLDILDLGNAGHFPDTQMPGEVGNFALAGHRRSYGNNFRQVHIMEPGDPIIVETDKAFLVYEVTDHEIVLPGQTEVLLPVPNEPSATPTQRIMTMTTCDPEFGNSHRFILRSELKYWVAKEDGRPQVLEGVK